MVRGGAECLTVECSRLNSSKAPIYDNPSRNGCRGSGFAGSQDPWAVLNWRTNRSIVAVSPLTRLTANPHFSQELRCPVLHAAARSPGR